MVPLSPDEPASRAGGGAESVAEPVPVEPGGAVSVPDWATTLAAAAELVEVW